MLPAEPLCLVKRSGDSGCTILFPQEVHLFRMFVLWLLCRNINPACSSLSSDCGSGVVQYEPHVILCPLLCARPLSSLYLDLAQLKPHDPFLSQTESESELLYN
jgi:hypothetical protein